jgi:hypothetical protein
MELSQNHMRVMAASLYTLEKSIERIEGILTTQHRYRITYEVNDLLDDEVRDALLQDLERMGNIIESLKEKLSLKPRKESMTRNLRVEAINIWEALSEMGCDDLDRYGNTPKELSDVWDAKVKALIKISLRIETKLRNREGKSI